MGGGVHLAWHAEGAGLPSASLLHSFNSVSSLPLPEGSGRVTLSCNRVQAVGDGVTSARGPGKPGPA